jgi:hypothetical protein
MSVLLRSRVVMSAAQSEIKINSRRRTSMNLRLARQEIAMKLKAQGRVRATVGAVACAATVALMPLSALAHTSAVSETVLCANTCKPAAAFDRAALITSGGGTVLVSGPITCRVGDSARIRATVSQASTGAVAEGLWSNRCTGTPMHWHMTATVTDGVHFSVGGADGAGLAIIRRQGVAGGAIQWIRPLTLKAA